MMTRANIAHEKAVQYKAEVDSCADDMALAVSLIKVMNERNKLVEQDRGLLEQENAKQMMQIAGLQAYNKKLYSQNKTLRYFCFGFGLISTGIAVGLYVNH